MSYYLIVSFVVAIIAIVYIWYITRNINYIPDTTILSLHTTHNSLLELWYKRFSKPSFSFDTNEYETSSRLLKRLFDIDVNPNVIVIGENLSSQYYNLTSRNLPLYSPDNHHHDVFFDIRSAIGINYDIAVINNPRLRSQLRRNNNIDLSETISIIDNDLDIIARDYLTQVLKYRWDKINELSDFNVLNNSGSFLYLRNCNIPNIETFSLPSGSRINLLCNDSEFETLIKRWKSSIETIQQPSTQLLSLHCE